MVPSSAKSTASSHLQLLAGMWPIPALHFICEDSRFFFRDHCFGGCILFSSRDSGSFGALCLRLKRVVHALSVFATPKSLTIQNQKSLFASTGVSNAAIAQYVRHVNIKILDSKPIVRSARYLPNRRHFRQLVYASRHPTLQPRQSLVKTCPLPTPQFQHSQ